MPNPVPRVGVAVIVLNSKSHVLVGKRKGSHGAGTIALPGGHLEFGESFEDCARREVLEETALRLNDVRFLTATNDIMANEGKHYITIAMVGKMVDEEAVPRIMEPDKCEKWEWTSWEQLKRWENRQGSRSGENGMIVGEVEGESPRLFSPLINLIRQQPEIMSYLRQDA